MFAHDYPWVDAVSSSPSSLHSSSPLHHYDMDPMRVNEDLLPAPGLLPPPGLEYGEDFTDSPHAASILSLLEADLCHRAKNQSHNPIASHDTFNFDREAKAFYPEANHWKCDSAVIQDWMYMQEGSLPVVNNGMLYWEHSIEDTSVDAPPGLSQLPSVSASRSHTLMEQACSWHESAKSVGTVSLDGHVFTKTCGGEKFRTVREGLTQRLSSICMVFDRSLRCGGTHRYNYHILDGEVGPADGAGFVFDSKVRRNNIQRMRAVFLNQRGQICVRNQVQVNKLDVQLPPLQVGMWLSLCIDLDKLNFQFMVCDANGRISGMADVGLGKMVEGIWNSKSLRSGFFCAVLTKDISVSLA